jgi:hypothetical protein
VTVAELAVGVRNRLVLNDDRMLDERRPHGRLGDEPMTDR